MWRDECVDAAVGSRHVLDDAANQRHRLIRGQRGEAVGAVSSGLDGLLAQPLDLISGTAAVVLPRLPGTSYGQPGSLPLSLPILNLRSVRHNGQLVSAMLQAVSRGDRQRSQLSRALESLTSVARHAAMVRGLAAARLPWDRGHRFHRHPRKRHNALGPSRRKPCTSRSRSRPAAACRCQRRVYRWPSSGRGT